ncbi:MarR family winged helix-turn-helix transcriptional regulator [Sedimenticola thiotaurini]
MPAEAQWSSSIAQGINTTMPFAPIIGIRRFFSWVNFPFRDFARAKPLPPVSAMEGTRMKSPGDTIKLFTVAIVVVSPKISTRRVAEKNIATHKMATNAANLWSRSVIVSSGSVNLVTYCHYASDVFGCQHVVKLLEELQMKESGKGSVFTNIVLEVFRLGGLLVSEGDQMGFEYGVTSARWKVLGALSLAGEPQTASQIARSMGLTRQAVQRLVDAMYEDQLLIFHENPDHKRAKLISLSELGEEVYLKLDEKQTEWATKCSIGITKVELETTLSVLKRISDTLNR